MCIRDRYTINAARTFGIADHIGSLEDGKMADVVVWRPAFFGIKPELVIKSGFIAWGAMAVSYTHLDVYKRQSQSGPRPAQPPTRSSPAQSSPPRAR